MSDLPEFQALGLSEQTLDALRVKGFEKPSAIQALTIPKLLTGERDLIGQAQTGTGKTAAFALPILELAERSGKPQALILAPTRELSIQISDEINSLKGKRDLRIAPFYGGQNIEIQLQRLRSGIDVVVGTPGRIQDLMRRGELNFTALKFAVLDEADEMLDMGFIEDIEAILGETNPDKRMLMFSATMPDGIRKIAEKFMRDSEIVRAQAETLGTELTEQICYEVRREDKFEALSRLIDMNPEMSALVFCRTRVDVDELTEKLNQKGHRVEALHGDIAQLQRTRVINRFKEKKFRLLIATDVAARGIDVNDLSHVINYSLPQNAETYVHRIGRTGRAGKKGVAITFATPGESRKLSFIQKDLKTAIKKMELPQGADIVEAKKQRFAVQLAEIIEMDRHSDYINFAEELFTLADNPADVLAAALQMRFRNELIEEHYPVIGAKKRDRKSWENAEDDRGMTRLFVGVGKLDGFGAVKMLDLIWERARIKKSHVGRIDCFDKFSFLNMEPEDAERFMQSCKKSGPKVQLASEVPDSNMKAERRPRSERPACEEKAEALPPKKSKPKTPPAEKKRRLKDWVDKMSADIELKEKRKKKK